jgi:hypothetical protein
VRTAKDADWVFVESGTATAMARHEAQASAAHALAEGDSYTQRGTEPGLTSRRAPVDLLALMPRAFADSLPRRAQRFAVVSTEPMAVGEVGYDEVAPWLNGEPALRAALVTRYGVLAPQARFRQGLVAELASHPEWRRVLFPEPVRAKAPTTIARRPSPPLDNRPATADDQWRVHVEPLTVEAVGAPLLAGAPAESLAPADASPPPADPPARGDTP